MVLRPGDQRSEMSRICPYLIGPFNVLAMADAFENDPSLEFLERLYNHIEQPLVDNGLIEPVRARSNVPIRSCSTPDASRAVRTTKPSRIGGISTRPGRNL